MKLYNTHVKIFCNSERAYFRSKPFMRSHEYLLHPICYVSPKTGTIWAKIEALEQDSGESEGDWHVQIALSPDDSECPSRDLPGILGTLGFKYPVPHELWVREFQIALTHTTERI